MYLIKKKGDRFKMYVGLLEEFICPHCKAVFETDEYERSGYLRRYICGCPVCSAILHKDIPYKYAGKGDNSQ